MGNSYPHMPQLWPSHCIGSRGGVPQRWESEADKAFRRLKTLLTSEELLVHFDPHPFQSVSQRRDRSRFVPLLTRSQRNYSQIPKGAMANVYAWKIFYHFCGIIVTDHKPLHTLFGPEKATPSLAVNRLARWALFLNQFSYQIVGDVLSRLPAWSRHCFRCRRGC